MKVISVQSQSGGTGVTLTAAELALTALAEGNRVLAVDTSPWRCLKEDLDEAGFHYLDDVRQLFRPLGESRWTLNPMPRAGILHYPEAAPHYLSLDEEGRVSMGYAVPAAQEERAEFNLAAALGSLLQHYDMVIIDVMNKDKRLMQLFYDICDEVHVMLRDDMPHARTVDDWRGDLDTWGHSIALKPYIEAAQNWRSPSQPAQASEVMQ